MELDSTANLPRATNTRTEFNSSKFTAFLKKQIWPKLMLVNKFLVHHFIWKITSKNQLKFNLLRTVFDESLTVLNSWEREFICLENFVEPPFLGSAIYCPSTFCQSGGRSIPLLWRCSISRRRMGRWNTILAEYKTLVI